MVPLSLRTTISGLSVVLIAVVAVITLTITFSTSLDALRTIGESHASILLDGAGQKTLTLFDGPLTITEVFQNYTGKYQWDWPSDSPSVYNNFRTMHESAFFSSKLQSATILTYCADNTRWFYGPFIPDGTLYVMQNHIASSITAADWNYTQQTIANEVDFRFMSNHSEVPMTNAAWSVPLALSKVRTSGLWDSKLVVATGGGAVSVIAPVSLVNFANISNLFVPIFAPLYRRDDDPTNSSQLFAVTVAALYINEISNFLRDIRGTPNTQSFAIEGSGYLVGSSLDATIPFQVESAASASDPLPGGCASTDGSSGVSTNTDVVWVCRTHARDYGYVPLQKMASLEHEGTNFLLVDGSVVMHELVGGEYFYFASVNLPLRAVGLRVQLLLAMPEEDIIGDVIAGRNVAIGITAVVVVLVAIAMFLLVTALLRPLDAVSKRMMLAATLEDEDAETDLSVMQEVANLQMSYDAMNGELCRIRSFVPQSIIASRATVDDVDLDLETAAADERTAHESVRSRQSNKSGPPSSHSTSAGVAALAAFRVQSASVLVCNLSGFQKATGTVSKDHASHSIAEMVDLVVTEASDHLGVLASFNGDSFTVTFNAVRPCPSHARRACSTALAIVERAPMIGLKLAARAGISTSKCLMGNTGSSTVKSFNVVGPAVTQAAVLERMAKLYDVPVLAADRSCTDIAANMTYRTLDVVMLPGRATPTSVGAIIGARSEKPSTSIDQGDGEWLYVMQRNNDGDPNAVPNEAFRLLLHGDRTGARAVVDHAVSPVKNPNENQPTLMTRKNASAPLEATVKDTAGQPMKLGAERLAELLQATDDQPIPARDLGPYYAAAFIDVPAAPSSRSRSTSIAHPPSQM